MIVLISGTTFLWRSLSIRKVLMKWLIRESLDWLKILKILVITQSQQKRSNDYTDRKGYLRHVEVIIWNGILLHLSNYNQFGMVYPMKCTCSCVRLPFIMMTSSNGNIFRVTGPLFGEFIGHRWISLTKASDAELWCFLLDVWSVPE